MNINKFTEKAKKVLKKRTCIRNELQELMKKINSELSEIPDSDEPHLSMTIREWNTWNSDIKIEHRLDIDMDFQNDAMIEIYIGTQHEDCGWKYEEQSYFSSLSIPNCRAIADKLPEVFQKYLGILEERGKDYDSTIAIIEKLKKGLAGD